MAHRCQSLGDEGARVGGAAADRGVLVVDDQKAQKSDPRVLAGDLVERTDADARLSDPESASWE